MRGITHLTLGLLSAAGIVALRPDLTGYSLTGMAVAGLASLAPDLDEPGARLGRDISFDPKYFRYALVAAAVAIGLWGWYRLDISRPARTQALLAALTLGVIAAALAGKTGRRVMVAVTGGLIMIAALWLQLFWLALLGAFVIIAPFLKHRTYTHTGGAVVLWGYICYGAARTLRDDGIFWLGAWGYLSHLVGDSLTKSGIPWLLPILNHRFALPLMSTGSRRGNFLEGLICAGVGVGTAALWVARFRGALR
ncbi:MAG: metal-dependent hydrolase [Hymenobacteraceae bacterium]|nr:metal-dependent hydrolase [Hymenobacteraceae bacterium]